MHRVKFFIDLKCVHAVKDDRRLQVILSWWMPSRTCQKHAI